MQVAPLTLVVLRSSQVLPESGGLIRLDARASDLVDEQTRDTQGIVSDKLRVEAAGCVPAPADVITGLTVGTSGSDINLDSVNITAGQQVAINSAAITHGTIAE